MILSVLGLLWALTTGVSDGHEAKSSPQLVARRSIVLQFQDAAKRTTLVTVGIGQVATIATPGAPVLHISPTESSEKLLTLACSLVSADSGKVISAVLSGPIALQATTSVVLGDYFLDVTWLEEKSVESLALDADLFASECCVVCEGIKTCACRVQAPCGSCCDRECGGCADPDGQVRRRPARATGGRPALSIDQWGDAAWRITQTSAASLWNALKTHGTQKVARLPTLSS
jgi:hypothetical protein